MAGGLPSRYLVALRQLVCGWHGFHASLDVTWSPSSPPLQVVADGEGCMSRSINKRCYLWIRLSHWKVFEREKTHLVIASVCCKIWEIHPPNMIVYSQTLQALSLYLSLL